MKRLVGPGVLMACALTAAITSGCTSGKAPSATGSSTTRSVARSNAALVSATPVASTVPAFDDNSGGTLEPASDGTKFPLTAGKVQALVAKDGAATPWVADSPHLVVRSGRYVGGAGVTGPQSPAGVAAYVFSGNTGPCPPSSGGGAGTPAPGSMQPTSCIGTVVADAATGRIVDVEVRPK